MTALAALAEAPAAPSLGALIDRLMTEARCAARDHVGELDEALNRVALLAHDVAEGGAAYPVGVRSICRHLAASMPLQQRSLRAFQPAA